MKFGFPLNKNICNKMCPKVSHNSHIINFNFIGFENRVRDSKVLKIMELFRK